MVIFVPDMPGSLFRGMVFPIPDERKMGLLNRGDQELYGLRRVFAPGSCSVFAGSGQEKEKGPNGYLAVSRQYGFLTLTSDYEKIISVRDAILYPGRRFGNDAKLPDAGDAQSQ